MSESKKGIHPNYRLTYEDHFDSETLNEVDWRYRTAKRLGGQNKKENVVLEDSQLKIKFDHEQCDGQSIITGGGIISNQLFGYGYYEAKGKLFGATGGLHSSFWSMGQNGGDGITIPKYNMIIELDGYEVNSSTYKDTDMNMHYYIGAHKHVGGYEGTLDYEPIDTSAEEFIFGYEWLPNQVNWYLNGELVRHFKNPRVYGPQNFWLTALGSNHFGEEIDLAKLPGESSWDYFRYYTIPLPGVNMIVNPSFEYNDNRGFDKNFKYAMDVPVGWIKEGTNPQASMVHVTGEAYDGECVLRHHFDQDYQVTTKVIIPYLVGGDYTLTAMVRNIKGGQHKILIKSGKERKLIDIPQTSGSCWFELEEKIIPIGDGHCTIEIYSDAMAGACLEIDEISFCLDANEEAHTPLEPFEEEADKPLLALGAYIVHYSIEDSGYEEVGDWIPCGLSGLYTSSRVCWDLDNCEAMWKPNIEAEGVYQVSYYNVCDHDRIEKAKLYVYYKGGCDVYDINQIKGHGWIDLGEYLLNSESYMKIVAEEGTSGIYFQADAVIFDTKEAKALREYVIDSYIFKTDENQFISQGVQNRYVQARPKISTYLEGSSLMVPLEKVAQSFGAVRLKWDEQQGQVEIFFGDHMIYFNVDSDIMTAKNEEIKMQAICRNKQGICYVSIDDLAKAFGMNVWKVSNELITVSRQIPDVQCFAQDKVEMLLAELF